MFELFLFLLGFGLGWWINSWLSAQAFAKILQDLDVSDTDIVELAKRELGEVSTTEAGSTDKTEIELKVEQHGDTLYAYTTAQDEFVAQGITAEALFAAIVVRYPAGHRFVIDQGRDLVQEYTDQLDKARLK